MAKSFEEFEAEAWKALCDRATKAEREVEEANNSASTAWRFAVLERDKVCAFALAFGLTSITQKQRILRAMDKINPAAAKLVQKTFKQKRYHRDV
jgi:hypothetical protein